MSRRKSVSGEYAGSFFLTNITLFSNTIRNHLSLSASVYNLFDKHYGDPVSADLVQDVLQQDGRSYRLERGRRYAASQRPSRSIPTASRATSIV